MPRTVLEPRFQVEHLSILDSDGNLDSSLAPDISPAELKRLYRAMLLGRRLDERMIRLQRQGCIGTFAPIKGQEASQVGAAATLRRTDWMVPSFRETAAMLWVPAKEASVPNLLPRPRLETANQLTLATTYGITSRIANVAPQVSTNAGSATASGSHATRTMTTTPSAFSGELR